MSEREKERELRIGPLQTGNHTTNRETEPLIPRYNSPLRYHDVGSCIQGAEVVFELHADEGVL